MGRIGKRLGIGLVALVLLGMGAALVPAAAPAASKQQLKRKVVKLKRTVRSTRVVRDRYELQRDSARNDVRRVGRERDSLAASLRIVTGERDAARSALGTVTAERDAANGALAAANGRIAQLEGGLPGAIGAVSLDRFYELVLAPARVAWPCDSLYVSGDYWSLEFTTRTYC